MPCLLVIFYRRFGGAHCLHFNVNDNLRGIISHTPAMFDWNARYLPFCQYPTARPSTLASRSWWRHTHGYGVSHSDAIRRHCSFLNIQDTHARQFTLSWYWSCHWHLAVSLILPVQCHIIGVPAASDKHTLQITIAPLLTLLYLYRSCRSTCSFLTPVNCPGVTT
jgi:hypothetical protein